MVFSIQVYRDLKEVTPEAMQMVKRNFEWVAERVKVLSYRSPSQYCYLQNNIWKDYTISPS